MESGSCSQFSNVFSGGYSRPSINNNFHSFNVFTVRKFLPAFDLTLLCFNVILSPSVIWLESWNTNSSLPLPRRLLTFEVFGFYVHSFSFPDEITPVQISLQVTFPKFLIIAIPLLQTLLKAAVSFLKSDSLMGSLPVYSWAAWSLPFLTRKLLSAQLPTAQPSRTQIWFWFSFPQLWGERDREREILPHSKSSFSLVLAAPT